MRPERNFVAERTLAQHCPQLLRTAVPASDLLPQMAAAAEQFARHFTRALPGLTGGEAPQARCNALSECTFGDLKQDIGPLAANSLLALGGAQMLFSVEPDAVLQLIDRAFGGKGEVPTQLPEQFPVSGDLLMAKLEALAIDALARALGGALCIKASRRDSSVARLAPFPDSAPLVLSTIVIKEGATAWQVSLAVPLDMLPELVGGTGKPAATNSVPADGPPHLAAPFDDMPLTLRAVLVDLHMPVSAISALVPGQVIPVAVARNVPLSVGGCTIAHGAIGTMEDRVAVRISQSFQQQDLNS